MSQTNSKPQDYAIYVIAAVLSLTLLGAVAYVAFRTFGGTKTEVKTEAKLKATSLSIGILGSPKRYNELAQHLRQRFDNQVQINIDGDSDTSYTTARNRIINKEWDIVFTLSPMLSVAARDNQYTFAARMFPKYPPYYRGGLFVPKNSPIQSIQDLDNTHTVALGDFNSASSFYMPIYDLYGKSLRVIKGQRGSQIVKLVKNGKADVGAATIARIEKDPGLRIIHISRQIPGSGVYLSPNLSQSDQQIIKKALLEAPAEIKKQSNYDTGKEADYSSFVQISRKSEEVLECANFSKNPVNFYCPKNVSTKTNSSAANGIQGRINGWSRKNKNTEQFKLSSDNGKTYYVVIERAILNKIPNGSNPIALQNKLVKINGVESKKVGNHFEFRITQPSQLVIE